MRFTDQDHFNDRMLNCLVIYKGQPCIVEAAVEKRNTDQGDDFKLALRVSGKRKTEAAWTSDPDLRYMDLPLGYVNIELGKTVFYLQRPPLRQWRQSLSSRNISIADRMGSEDFGYEPLSSYYGNIAECINGNFPTFSEIRKNGGVGAVSRSIAVNGDKVYWKTFYAGKIGNLNPKFSFLRGAF